MATLSKLVELTARSARLLQDGEQIVCLYTQRDCTNQEKGDVARFFAQGNRNWEENCFVVQDGAGRCISATDAETADDLLYRPRLLPRDATRHTGPGNITNCGCRASDLQQLCGLVAAMNTLVTEAESRIFSLIPDAESSPQRCEQEPQRGL